MNYLTVTAPDINNGNGLRVTVWVAGCSNRCPGCHNQHTWNYNQGNPIMQAMDEINEWINRKYINGLTVSGGDPFSQTDENLDKLHEFLLTFKSEHMDKNIWLYTGEIFEHALEHPIKRRIIELCDVIIDGPFINELRDTTLAFRGSSNQRIIDVTKSLESNDTVVMHIA